jgi:hypothetical protein
MNKRSIMLKKIAVHCDNIRNTQVGINEVNMCPVPEVPVHLF